MCEFDVYRCNYIIFFLVSVSLSLNATDVGTNPHLPCLVHLTSNIFAMAVDHKIPAPHTMKQRLELVDSYTAVEEAADVVQEDETDHSLL